MNIAARTGAWAGSGEWTNPYVTDGLIGMWDAEWNAGGGVHSDDLTTLKDLTSYGHDLTATGAVTYADKFFTFSGNGYKATVTGDKTLGRGIEVVADVVSGDGSGNILCSYFGYPMINAQNSFFASVFNFDLRVFRWFADMTYFYTHKGKMSASYSGAEWGEVAAGRGLYISGSSVMPVNTYSTSGVSDEIQVGSNAKFKIANCRVYDRILTAEDIAANHAVDVERFGIA